MQRPPPSPPLLPLSADVLLKVHSATHDSNLGALEQAISNRNNALPSQNSQLWKIREKQKAIIEKQRAEYTHILKELERVRGERDTYEAMLRIRNPSDRSHKVSVTQQSNDHRPSLPLVSCIVIT